MIGSDTVTVLRPSGPVPFGETRPLVVDHQIPGCAFAPTGGYELSSSRETAITQPTIYAPPGADILNSDTVVVRGLHYEVDGVPATWVHPTTGATVGLAIPLRGVTG